MDRRIKLNYPAIVVAGVAYWCVQAAWYKMLGQQWLLAIGRTAADMGAKGNSPIPYVGSLICDIIVACVMAWILVRLGEPSAAKGASLGAALALGLVTTAIMTQYLFEQRPVTLFLINAGGALAGMVVAGAIVGAWKTKAPAAASATA